MHTTPHILKKHLLKSNFFSLSLSLDLLYKFDKMNEKSKKYEEELLRVIKEKKIAFFDHCFGFTSFSRTTAYDYKLNESDVIKDAINQNRVTAKNYMLNKWIESNNPTLEISAYRLLSTPEEHRLLNQNTNQVDVDTNQVKPIEIVIRKNED